MTVLRVHTLIGSIEETIRDFFPHDILGKGGSTMTFVKYYAIVLIVSAQV